MPALARRLCILGEVSPLSCCDSALAIDGTFGEQPSAASLHMFPQIPSIAEVVIFLDQLYAIALCQAYLIRTSCGELVCSRLVNKCGFVRLGVVNVRTASRLPPGCTFLGISSGRRCAMVSARASAAAHAYKAKAIEEWTGV